MIVFKKLATFYRGYFLARQVVPR